MVCAYTLDATDVQIDSSRRRYLISDRDEDAGAVSATIEQKSLQIVETLCVRPLYDVGVDGQYDDVGEVETVTVSLSAVGPDAGIAQ